MDIATGERLFSKWDYAPLLERRLVDVIQPDLCHAGGHPEGGLGGGWQRDGCVSRHPGGHKEDRSCEEFRAIRSGEKSDFYGSMPR